MNILAKFCENQSKCLPVATVQTQRIEQRAKERVMRPIYSMFLSTSVKLFSGNKLCSDLKNLPTSNLPLTLFSLLTLFNFVENLSG